MGLATVQQVLQDALALPPGDRGVLIDELISSLNRVEPAIDALWVQEAESRLAAFEAGKMKAVPMEEAFRDIERS